MKLERRLKLALDESRLLILGAQVLFGFQFNGIFQELFEELSTLSRGLACSGLVLMTLTLGLLVAPSMHHRIVERGQESLRVLALATFLAGLALLPLAVALALDVFIAMQRMAGERWGAAAGAAFFVLAILCWYAMGFWFRRKRRVVTEELTNPTPLEAQVDQLLTEARVIIPGAQALLGFQLTVTLTRAFAQLPPGTKMIHAVALCCIAFAVILLMATAALHRISFGGEDDPEFLRIGSVLVIGAPVPLAAGIALDTYVAAERALDSMNAAGALAATALVVLLGLWYVFPIWKRLAVRN